MWTRHFARKLVRRKNIIFEPSNLRTVTISTELKDHSDTREVRRLVLERIRENGWSSSEIAESLKIEINPLSIFLKNRRQWYRSSIQWRKENEEVAMACTWYHFLISSRKHIKLEQQTGTLESLCGSTHLRICQGTLE